MNYNIKDLPEPDRPREKLKDKGIKHLTDSEVLALVLGSGTKEKNAKELAMEVINEHGIRSIQDISTQTLSEINGISEAKAARLKGSAELGQRILKEDRQVVRNFDQLSDLVKDLGTRNTEILRIYALSGGNRIKQEFEYEGSPEELRFPISKILRDVLVSGASGFVICHNHPSGNPKPSESDLLTTRRLVDAAEALGIKLLDHVIVGEEVLSMRASSEILFQR